MESDYRKFRHHHGAKLASDEILSKIKTSKDWANQFLDSSLCKARCKQQKPSPDGRFYSANTKCHVALEFKPAYSDLDEIGKGYSQCMDYIVDKDERGNFLNQASYLVIPSKNEKGNDIENIYLHKFKHTVLNKNAVALVTYNPFNPKDLKLVLNFGEKCGVGNIKDIYGKNEITYWSAWRENYPSFNYHLLKTAADFSGHYNESSAEKIYQKFYDDFYCAPPAARSTLDLIDSPLKTWGDELSIWAKSKKKKLKDAVDKGTISYADAIKRLRWDAAYSPDERREIGKHIENLPILKPSKINSDNDYMDIKKNRRNFLSHVGLWDNLTFKPTELGLLFLQRIESKSDEMLELGTLLLFFGRWWDLIQDIKKHQQKISHNCRNEWQENLKRAFLKNGLIGVNPGRSSTGSRNFLQSEQQVLGKLGILRMTNNTYYQAKVGWEFDDEKITDYLENYYKYYERIDIAA